MTDKKVIEKLSAAELTQNLLKATCSEVAKEKEAFIAQNLKLNKLLLSKAPDSLEGLTKVFGDTFDSRIKSKQELMFCGTTTLSDGSVVTVNHPNIYFEER